MEFLIKSGQPHKQRTACIIVGVFEGKKLPEATKQLDRASGGAITQLLKRGDFRAKLGQAYITYDLPNVVCERVLIMGCGKERDFDASQYETLISRMHEQLKQLNCVECVCFLTLLPLKKRNTYWRVRLAVSYLLKADYNIHFYQSQHAKTDRTPQKRVVLAVSSRAELPVGERALHEGQIIATAAQQARQLGDRPPNEVTPEYLVTLSQQFAQTHQLKCEILDEATLHAKGMQGILAVSQGSAQPGFLITSHYYGSDAKTPPIILVGKGVTFDSGGLCIKPWESMYSMKMDMLGAATVMATFQAVVQLKLPINLICITPVVENMAGQSAFRPGDIIKTYSGKTVEVINTDAEGRMILCDALHYANEFKPQMIIDVATLTGAIITALGHHMSGIFSNQQRIANQLLRCGEMTDDRAWQLPITAQYHEQLKSKIADMRNIGGSPAGSITAACFLEKFVGTTPWAHIDIAGTAMNPHAATGRSVPMLCEFLLQQAQITDKKEAL